MFAGEPPSSSDPTKRLCRRISFVLDAFRRLLLQIGGANIAGADRAGKPPSSLSLGDEKRVPSLRLSTAARDPGLDCLARWRSLRAVNQGVFPLKAMNAARAVHIRPSYAALCGETAAAESASQHHSFFKAWKKGWSSFVHLN
jgi:hypothetical protein